MRRTFLLKSLLLLCALVAGMSSAWGVDYTADFSSNGSPFSANTQSVTITDNNLEATWGISVTWLGSGSYWSNDKNATQIGASKSGSTERAAKKIVISTSNIPGTITSVVVNAASNSSSGTLGVKVGSSSFSVNSNATTTTLTNTLTDYTFSGSATGAVEMTFDNTVSGKYFKIASIKVTYSTGSSSDPSISANNVNIDQDATNGSIEYSLSNATGNVSASITSGDWLTLGEITASAVPFTCSANTGAERTATVTLSFTGATDKVVTITQAAKTVADPEFNLEGNKRYWQGTEITLTSAGNTIYYNMTTDGTDPATPTSNSTQYSAPIVLGNNTAKIWAIAYDTYGNKSSVVKRTYTGVAPATLPFSWNEQSTTTTGIICSTGVSTYNSSPYLKISATDQNVILKFDGVPGTLTFDIKGNTFSGGTFKVQTSADGETYSDLKEYTSLGDKATETFILANTVRYIKWVYTEKSNGNVALGNINLTAYSPTITLTPAKEYTTLTSAYALDFTSVEGLKAFIVEDDDATDGKITMTQVNKVPAGTGLVLKATTPNAAVSVPVFDGTGADDVSANKMEGSATETTAVAANAGYILKDGEFHPATAGTLAAGKAYLKIAVNTNANTNAPLAIDFGDATGINMVNCSGFMVNGSEVYNLNGQRVAQPTKGLYIVNGKKVVIK